MRAGRCRGGAVGALAASTEIVVLLRNPNVDATTTHLLAHYRRCHQRRETELVVSIIRA